MASIIQMPNGNWRALCRRAGFKTQCQTFPKKGLAETWSRNIESEWDKGVATGVSSNVTVSQLIQAYRELREKSRPISDKSNEHYQLKMLDRYLGKKVAAALTTDQIVAFAEARKDEGAGPYTLNMDLSKLGTVFRYGGSKLKIVLPDVIGTARPTLNYLRLIGGGGKRERRPTEDEFDRITDWFQEKHPRFLDAVLLAPVAAFRRGEITQELKWSVLDQKARMVSIWRKHPRKGKQLKRVPLLPEAWEIIKRQPRVEGEDRIFPFDGTTLSKYFTKACKELGIPDLHFHDLRHEAASSLLEAGYTETEAMLVTGHDDPRHFRRYTNLRPEDIHEVKPRPRKVTSPAL